MQKANVKEVQDSAWLGWKDDPLGIMQENEIWPKRLEFSNLSFPFLHFIYFVFIYFYVQVFNLKKYFCLYSETVWLHLIMLFPDFFWRLISPEVMGSSMMDVK